MKNGVNARVVQIAAIILAAVMLLIVNREFGVADNGDFSRYMHGLTSKPVYINENWPQRGSEDWKRRFFREPIFYWSNDDGQSAWLTSASLFWHLGKKINQYMFHQDVINLKYLGLPFFLIHFFGLFYFLERVSPKYPNVAFVFVSGLILMTDARITAFYNSLYGETIPILTIFLIFSFFCAEQFSNSGHSQHDIKRKIFSILLLFMFLATIFSKIQYVYFILPTLLFVFYAFLSNSTSITKFKFLMLACFAVFLIGIITGITVYETKQRGISTKIYHALQRGISTNTYHALYYGILPHSKDPLQLMEQLGLPLESRELIGKLNPVGESPSINVKTFFSAIVADPNAFVHLLLCNAKQVGNFDIPLGMVYGNWSQYPPELISVFSSIFTKYSGITLSSVILLLSLALLAYPCGGTPERRFSSRVFTTILLTVILADAAVSTFDGQSEVRKHVHVASISLVMMMIHVISSMIEHLSNSRLKKTNEGYLEVYHSS